MNIKTLLNKILNIITKELQKKMLEFLKKTNNQTKETW